MVTGDASAAIVPPSFEDMECGRLLIRNGRAWLKLTDEDVERGAWAVVRDCTYRAEIARSAIRRAHDIEDPVLVAALTEAWERLNETPCVCTRTNGSNAPHASASGSDEQ